MKLFGLYKNGKIAKISQDESHLQHDYEYKLMYQTMDNWTIKEIPNDLEFDEPPRSNKSLGLASDGGPQLTQSTADAIGRALERCEDSTINWKDDSEFKSQAIIDKINNME